MDAGFLFDFAPTSTLAVEYTHHAVALIYIPNFKEAAETQV